MKIFNRKKSKINLKMNKAGSTLIIVLIMCSFILILASSVTSVVMLNLRMKKTKLNSKSSFYTSEEAVDEIYLSLSKTAMESFNMAYIDELRRYSDNLNQARTDASFTNASANSLFRKNYTIRLLEKLGIITETNRDNYLSDIYLSANSFDSLFGEFDVDKKENLIETLKSFLETNTEGKLDVKDILSLSLTKENETLTDFSGLNVSLDNYTLKIKDITISYMTSAGYYSDITIDFDISFPSELLDLVDTNLIATTNFSKYALIGNTGIINTGSTNLYASAYGGGETGITVDNNASLNFRGGENSNLISGSDINIKGGSFNLLSGRLWGENIFTKNNPSSLTIASNASAYLKDDLQLEADKSTATINGNLYGYGYVTANGASHLYSSSMIINSNESNIYINANANVLLSGNAYIGYNGLESPYATGFSYAGYGNQESYLVPSRYISSKVNPVPLITATDYNTAGNTGVINYKGKETTITIDESFFAYAFLNSDKPYELKLISNGDSTGSAYYYLNFKNVALKAVYAKLIESDEAFDAFKENSSYYQGLSNSKKEEYEEIRDALHDSLRVNASSTASNIYLSDYANMTALSDSIYDSYLRAVNTGSTTIDFNYDDYLAKYNNYSIRYNILHKILLPIEDVDTRLLTSADIGSEEVMDVAAYSDNVFNNFISSEGFRKYIQNRAVAAHNYGVISEDDYMLVAIDNEGASKNAVIVDSSLANSSYSQGKLKMSKGIIIASGDVTVRSDFTGLIMAKGTIRLEGNVNIYPLTESQIMNMIEADDGVTNGAGSGLYPFKSIFLYGYEAEDEDSLNSTDLEYTDLVEIKNWRN